MPWEPFQPQFLQRLWVDSCCQALLLGHLCCTQEAKRWDSDVGYLFGLLWVLS